MLGIRKRGSPMYPSEGPSELAENAPELKKRKTQSGTVDDASTSATTESPGLVSSGSSTPADEVPVKSIDKGKDIDKEERVGEDKGKSLDKPLGPIAELEQLRKELATKTEIIARQEKTINAVKDVMQCDICYDTGVSPYVLSCGHVACYKCLIQWWTTGADSGPALERWQPNGPSDDESEGEIENSPPPAVVALPPAVSTDNNAPPAEGGPSQTGDTAGDAVEEEEEDIPRAIHREKQCALCRTVIRTAPVQVYMLNKLHTIFGPPPKFKKNPWRGVFPSEKELKELKNRLNVLLPVEMPYDEEELAEFILPAIHPPPDDHPVVLPMAQAVTDHEDNVLRCALCLHEVWHGHCTNTECEAMYQNDSDDTRSDGASDTGPGGLNPDDDNPDWVVRDEAAPDEGDDNYEGSFIDDTDPSTSDPVQGDIAPHTQDSESHHETGSDDDNAPGPSRRRRRQVTRILSEPEPDSDASVPLAPFRSRRRARRLQETVVHSTSVSEDDVEGVIGSSNENTDDSPDSIHMGSRRRIESPASDGYNGEHIPYVWEEEEEDSGAEAGPSEESDMSSRPHLSANFKAESDAESYVY